VIVVAHSAILFSVAKAGVGMRRRLGFREVVLLSVFGVVLPLVAPTDAD
jgi:hypothetical protein